MNQYEIRNKRLEKVGAIAIVLFLLVLVILIPAQANAQETSGGFLEGSIRIGYDSRTCDGSLDGSIRFNSATACAEYCDGSDWICPASSGGGGCAAPTDCDTIGATCSDGSKFAGFMAGNDGSCDIIYLTSSNQSNAIAWKTSSGTNDIDPDSEDDGRINHTNRGGTLTDFPAMDLCESNTYHSKSDWYLPSRDELGLLWKNRTAIGSFTASQYWSSTEQSTSSARQHDFGSGHQEGDDATKTLTYDVRCIRRVSGAAAGSILCPANPLCPNVGDVCDDSNAGTTNDPLFAGFIVYDNATCEAVYVADSNQSAAVQWKTSVGANDIATDHANDGKLNDAQVADSATFPSFKLCKDLTDGGFADWYLPAKEELEMLWRNKTDIGGFTTSWYWSSTEHNTNYAWHQTFNDGFAGNFDEDKVQTHDVRCIRRD